MPFRSRMDEFNVMLMSPYFFKVLGRNSGEGYVDLGRGAARREDTFALRVARSGTKLAAEQRQVAG